MLKHSILIRWSPADGEYVAVIPELPGVSAVMPTPEQAVAEVQVAAAGCLGMFAEEGRSLPEPMVLTDHDGQIRVRLPRTLHARLAALAVAEGVSLNDYIVHMLSSGAERVVKG